MGPIANMEMSVRVVTVVVPVAVYFLILGLLNTRRHPQVLTGKADFALLIAALSPLAFMPAVGVLGASPAAAVIIAVAIALGIVLLAPPGRSWVIYNLPAGAAREVVADALEQMGLTVTRSGEAYVIAGYDATVTVEAFPLLRNVTVHLRGGGKELAGDFQRVLAWRLAGVESEATPMAVSMLLVAMMMLAAPLAMMARDVPQLVRIITDLLQ